MIGDGRERERVLLIFHYCKVVFFAKKASEMCKNVSGFSEVDRLSRSSYRRTTRGASSFFLLCSPPLFFFFLKKCHLASGTLIFLAFYRSRPNQLRLHPTNKLIIIIRLLLRSLSKYLETRKVIHPPPPRIQNRAHF
jgi:hypothetical protein